MSANPQINMESPIDLLWNEMSELQTSARGLRKLVAESTRPGSPSNVHLLIIANEYDNLALEYSKSIETLEKGQ